jgi:hypothetical protein
LNNQKYNEIKNNSEKKQNHNESFKKKEKLQKFNIDIEKN